MMKEQQVEIPLSKTKIIFTIIGCITFVLMGLCLLFFALFSELHFFGGSILPSISGISSIVFFGLLAIPIFKKYFDKNAGLIIYEIGIIDNSSGVSAGLILWSDIEEIKVTKVMNQKFIMLIVNNPQHYIDKASNNLKRKTAKINYKNYGSPISFSVNSLKISFGHLCNLLTQKMNEYKP